MLKVLINQKEHITTLNCILGKVLKRQDDKDALSSILCLGLEYGFHDKNKVMLHQG